MGRMKYGKPQPHANRQKGGPRKTEQKKPGQEEEEASSIQNDDTPQHFRKRTVDRSQSDRYDEPPEDVTTSDTDDEGEHGDETKDIEYIKKHHSGLSAHFQFKEEKEWNQFIENKEGNKFLELDLTRLANEMSGFCVYEKLRLQEASSSSMYCTDELREMFETMRCERNTSMATSPIATTTSSQTRNDSPTTCWDYSGVEKHRNKLKYSRTCQRATSVVTNDFILKDNTVFQTQTSVDDCMTNNNIRETNKSPSVTSEKYYDTTANDNSSCLLHTDSSIIANTDSNSTASNQIGDLDLDLLLETSLPSTKQPEQHLTSLTASTDTGKVQELDDWLDSILD